MSYFPENSNNNGLFPRLIYLINQPLNHTQHPELGAKIEALKQTVYILANLVFIAEKEISDERILKRLTPLLSEIVNTSDSLDKKEQIALRNLVTEIFFLRMGAPVFSESVTLLHKASSILFNSTEMEKIHQVLKKLPKDEREKLVRVALNCLKDDITHNDLKEGELSSTLEAISKLPSYQREEFRQLFDLIFPRLHHKDSLAAFVQGIISTFPNLETAKTTIHLLIKFLDGFFTRTQTLPLKQFAEMAHIISSLEDRRKETVIQWATTFAEDNLENAWEFSAPSDYPFEEQAVKFLQTIANLKHQEGDEIIQISSGYIDKGLAPEVFFTPDYLIQIVNKIASFPFNERVDTIKYALDYFSTPFYKKHGKNQDFLLQVLDKIASIPFSEREMVVKLNLLFLTTLPFLPQAFLPLNGVIGPQGDDEPHDEFFSRLSLEAMDEEKILSLQVTDEIKDLLLEERNIVVHLTLNCLGKVVSNQQSFIPSLPLKTLRAIAAIPAFKRAAAEEEISTRSLNLSLTGQDLLDILNHFNNATPLYFF